MCGIAGIINKKCKRSDFQNNLNIFQNKMHHRGPDHFGPHIGEFFAVTNLRLAIVDRAHGNQPMYSEDKKWGIVYNGEVYNHDELRTDLISKGFQFHTKSDTEVVLKLFLQYGEDSFRKLNGMFGICFFKTDGSEFILVRDGFGIKPLYIYEDNNKFYFSSELKGILNQQDIEKSLSKEGLQDYLFYRYIVSPLNICTKIKTIEPGTFIRIKDDASVSWRFFDIEYKPAASEITIENAKNQVDHLLQKAVKSQLMGEVPVGVLLSGGIDSSAIAYYVAKNGANLTTYNIGFPEVNEFEYSRAVANQFGFKYKEVTTTVEELIEDFENVIEAIDTPMADPACFPLYRLCKELKKDVIVVLSGEGGDEQFGGYNQYKHMLGQNINFDQRYQEFLNRSYYFKENLSLLKNHLDIPPRHHKSMKYFDENTMLNSMLAFDLRTWMPDNLMMKADKILMSHSLEGRFPFLDLDLFKYVSTIPEEYKIKNKDITKFILKELTLPHLPQKVVNRAKMGFTVPVDIMLIRLKDNVYSSLEYCKNHSVSELIEMSEVENQINNYYQNKPTGQDLKIWTLFVLMAWIRKNM